MHRAAGKPCISYCPCFLLFFLHFRLASLQTILFQFHFPRMLRVFVAASWTLLLLAISTGFSFFQDDRILSCDLPFIFWAHCFHQVYIFTHKCLRRFWKKKGQDQSPFFICIIGCSLLLQKMFLDFGKNKKGPFSLYGIVCS